MGTTSSFCTVVCLGEIDRPDYYDKIQSREINKLFSEKREGMTPDTRPHAGGSTDTIRLFKLLTKACTSAKFAFPLTRFTYWHVRTFNIPLSSFLNTEATLQVIKNY
jgi:hypothetical protein